MSQRLMRANEVAEVMGLKPARVYELSREGKLPFLVKIGLRQYRYHALGLHRFMENGGNEQPTEVTDEKK